MIGIDRVAEATTLAAEMLWARRVGSPGAFSSAVFLVVRVEQVLHPAEPGIECDLL